MSATISVIIPVLNDAPALARALASLRTELLPGDEVIVADGGPDAEVERVANASNTRYLCCRRGRAAQMNAGAAHACGEWLFFLHADCQVAPGGLAALRAVNDREWGCFRHRIDAPGLGFRIIERMDNLRARVGRLPFGDQGIFVRRAVFESLSGCQDVPLLEDVMLARTLGRRGPSAVLAPVLRADARRWQRLGVLRTTLINWRILWGYFVKKKAPQELAALYRTERKD